MKKKLALAVLCSMFLAAPVGAQPAPVDLGTDPAQAVAGRDLAPNDAKVAQARDWLKKVAGVTGESEEQVAASSMKLARFFFDSLKLRILPIEALEGMAVQAKPGQALSDLTSGYFQARRAAPDMSHAGALASLATKK